MDIRQLRYFLAVSDQRSFTRAAEHLDISQPSLSRAIAGFERELGVTLFHRVERTVVLTPAGTQLLSPRPPAHHRPTRIADPSVRHRPPVQRGGHLHTAGRAHRRSTILPIVLSGVADAVLPSGWTGLARSAGADVLNLEPTPQLHVALVHRREPLTPAAAAFVATVRAYTDHATLMVADDPTPPPTPSATSPPPPASERE